MSKRKIRLVLYVTILICASAGLAEEDFIWLCMVINLLCAMILFVLATFIEGEYPKIYDGNIVNLSDINNLVPFECGITSMSFHQDGYYVDQYIDKYPKAKNGVDIIITDKE